MWRRVASQSPPLAGGPQDAYVKAFSALGKMLRDGRSLSGHERNCCFLNTRDDRFATISAASGLDFEDDGRAIGLTDWDHDGDVDVWLANRTGPRLRFLRNDGQDQARFVTFNLIGTRCNRDAIGARLELHLSSPRTTHGQAAAKLIRSVHAGRGFMSQTSKRIHFGIGESSVEQLIVRWPDGQVEAFDDIRVGQHYDIVQASGRAKVWKRQGSSFKVKPSNWERPAFSNQSRIVITGRLPLPQLESKPIQSDAKAATNGPTLINLWSTSCLPCVKELGEFARRESEVRQSGLNVMALNVDEFLEDPASDLSRSKQILNDIAFPFAAAAIDADQSGTLDLFHQAFLSLRRPLPLPSSFLTTADGRIAVIYRGPISIQQLIDDIEILDSTPQSIRDHSVPFSGKWHAKPFGSNPKRHATAFMRNGFVDPGAKYLEKYLFAHLKKQGWGPPESWPDPKLLAELCDVLANFYRLQNEPNKVLGVYQIALNFYPEFIPSFMNLGKAMISQGKTNEGLRMLERANQLAPSDPIIASDLAIAYAMVGRRKSAEQIFLRLLNEHSETPGIRLNLARLYLQQRRYSQAAAQFANHLRLEPNSEEALRSLCWILTSSPNDRNPRQAKAVLNRLRRQLGESSAVVRDLSAALYAEIGDFDRATEEARQAIQLAKEQNDRTVAKIEERLRLYSDKKKFQLP